MMKKKLYFFIFHYIEIRYYWAENVSENSKCRYLKYSDVHWKIHAILRRFLYQILKCQAHKYWKILIDLIKNLKSPWMTFFTYLKSPYPTALWKWNKRFSGLVSGKDFARLSSSNQYCFIISVISADCERSATLKMRSSKCLSPHGQMISDFILKLVTVTIYGY